MRLPILILHVSAGILAMLAGTLAISFRKGSRNHRKAGKVFVLSMLMVSSAGAYLASLKWEPDNILGGIDTSYLIATAWATVRLRKIPALAWTAPVFALLIAATWTAWGLAVTSGRMVAGQGSSAGGYFFFGALALLCAAGDVRLIVRGLSERQRLLRHLWRMCFGWSIATVSFFLGQQQIFPRWLRGSIVLTVVAFLPLLFLAFWFLRVRFSKTFQGQWQVRDREPAPSVSD